MSILWQIQLLLELELENNCTKNVQQEKRLPSLVEKYLIKSRFTVANIHLLAAREFSPAVIMQPLKMEVMTSEKGTELIVIDGFKFSFHTNLSNNIKRWTCIRHNCTYFF